MTAREISWQVRLIHQLILVSVDSAKRHLLYHYYGCAIAIFEYQYTFHLQLFLRTRN